MTLPLILPPSGFPLPLVAGFSLTPHSPHDDVPMLQGEGRKRRMFTSAPRVASVAWIVPAALALAFDDWYEDTLQAGALQYTQQLQKLGPGFEYWTAEFVDRPQSEPIASPDGLWRITAALLLTGSPASALPLTGALALDTSIVLGGSVRVTQPNPLHLDTSIVLGTVTPLRLDTSIVLGYLSFTPPPDGGPIERLWARMAPTPVRSAYIDDSVQEQLERAWMGINNGIY